MDVAERSKLIATWVEVVGLLAGGVFAVVQYLSHAADVRVEKTIDFLSSWASEPVVSSYHKISTVWDDKTVRDEFLRLVDETRDDESAMEKGRKLGDFVLATTETYGLSQPIFRLNEFYTALSACVKKDVCDRPLAVEFFCADAAAFDERTRALTLQKRKIDPEYASGLTSFLAICESPKSSS